RLDPIDHLLALDPGGRGIAAFFQPGGALAAARALARARSVLIVTGFIVAEGMPETDGPPGAAVLGRALRRLGAGVRYTTDAATLPTLAAALKALGEPVEAFAYPDTPDSAREGALMARIASVVRVDHLVVAGVSNWGAYGIVAQLGRLTGGSLLHSPDDERRLIDACVAAGAVDGITRRAERTVDGLDADTH